LTAAALCGLARSGAAQEPAAVSIGSRVRLTLRGAQPPRVVSGRLLDQGPDTLTVGDERGRDRTVILRFEVGRLEVSARQEVRATKAFVVGAVAGAAVAGVIALVVVNATPACGDPTAGVFCRGRVPAGRMLGVLGLGAAIGAGLGYGDAVSHPQDVWSPAPWPSRVEPASSSTRVLPLLGLRTIGDHRLVVLGIRVAR